MEVSHFIRTLRTNMSGYTENIAQKLCLAAKNELPISTEGFVAKFVQSGVSPEIKQGLELFLPAYVIDGRLDNDSIKTLCFDMYAAAPYDFLESDSTIWQLS